MSLLEKWWRITYMSTFSTHISYGCYLILMLLLVSIVKYCMYVWCSFKTVIFPDALLYLHIAVMLRVISINEGYSVFRFTSLLCYKQWCSRNP